MQTALILSVLAPAAIAFVLLALGHQIWRAGASTGRWSLGVAPVLGAFAAYFVVRGVPGLPPNDAGVWPMWTSLAVAVTAIAGANLARSPLAGIISALVASVTTAWLVSEPLISNRWSATDAALWITGASVAITVAWRALSARAERNPGLGPAVGLAVLAATSAAVLGAGGTALLAQVGGGLAAALGVAVLLAFVRPNLAISAAVGPSVVMLGGILLAGMHYAEVSVLAVALLFAGALVAGLAPLPWVAAGGLRSAVVLGALTLVTGAGAVAATVLSSEPAAAEDAYGDDAYGDDAYGDDAYGDE